MSTVMLASLWWIATLMLVRQDRLGPRGWWRELRALRQLGREPVWRRVFVRGIREYLRRDFHPDQRNNYHLAARLLAKAAAAET